MFAKKGKVNWWVKNKSILTLVLMSVAIVAGLVLIKRDQDIRDEAAGKKPGNTYQQDVVNGGTKKNSGVQQGNVVKPPTKKSTQIRQN